ncbi:MAG: LysM peptidoglycan-binding domain-containing protein [Dethiobacteria bacterium]|jgi:LysM repeat protein
MARHYSSTAATPGCSGAFSGARLRGAGRIPVSCPPGFQGRYTVVSGDTMFLIAKRFGVTLDALIAANPHITNPSMIYPGDILCVPGPPPVGRVPVSCPPGFQGRYTVVSGDTMFLIAKRFGVTLDALIAANPHITDPNVLFPCDVLCVPCPRPGRVPVSCPPGFQGQYTVQPGDTMFLIAQRFRVTLDALISANPHISDPNLILPCDVLCIPCPLPADALPPPEEPRFPCCVVLKALPPPHPDCAPGGTAFVQLLPNKQNSVSILAVRLPEPATRGDFDAYQGIIESPGAPKVTFPLQLCQPDPSLWAGMVEALPKLSFATRVSVCPVDSETGETGKAVLAASLQRCT